MLSLSCPSPFSHHILSLLGISFHHKFHIQSPPLWPTGSVPLIWGPCFDMEIRKQALSRLGWKLPFVFLVIHRRKAGQGQREVAAAHCLHSLPPDWLPLQKGSGDLNLSSQKVQGSKAVSWNDMTISLTWNSACYLDIERSYSNAPLLPHFFHSCSSSFV